MFDFWFHALIFRLLYSRIVLYKRIVNSRHNSSKYSNTTCFINWFEWTTFLTYLFHLLNLNGYKVRTLSYAEIITKYVQVFLAKQCKLQLAFRISINTSSWNTTIYHRSSSECHQQLSANSRNFYYDDLYSLYFSESRRKAGDRAEKAGKLLLAAAIFSIRYAILLGDVCNSWFPFPAYFW